MPAAHHVTRPNPTIPKSQISAPSADGRVATAGSLADQLRFEQLLAEILGSLVDVNFAQMDAAIAAALGRISQALGSEMSTFLQASPETGVLRHTHEWIAPGVKFDFDFTNARFDLAESTPWLARELQKLKPIVISRLEDFPGAAASERALAERLGLRSVLWVPVGAGGRLVACIALNTLRTEADWQEPLVRRLSILGEVFVSASQRARSEQRAAEQIAFERLVAELSATFIALPGDQIDAALHDALRRIGECVGVDRCFIDQFSDDASELRVTHMWTAPGIPQDKFVFEVVLSDYVPWYTKRMASDQPVIFTDPDEMPAEAVNEKEYCRRIGIKSSAVVSLIVAGTPIGNFGFDTIRQERIWSEDTLKRLRLASHILGNALERKRADETLRRAHDEIRALKERLEAENVYLRKEIERDYSREGIRGQSKAIKDVLRQVDQVAGTGATVLLLGETGTGKELVASAIHRLSPRGDRPLVKVNCAALPATLVEAELFGREKGAYTGALTRQVGRFELANGSTLLLDEISELTLELQAKLLRVLEEGEFERLGSSRTLKVDVRVIAATNQDLTKAMRDGRFREDLYYRLNVFPIRVPPLRERRDDIPALVWGFAQEFGERMGQKIEGLDDSRMMTLQRYDWPGNVRELRNVVERAMILGRGRILRIDLPVNPQASAASDLTLRDLEKRHIESVLSQTRWRVSGKQGAAERLGLKATTLRSRMAKLGIKPPH